MTPIAARRTLSPGRIRSKFPRLSFGMVHERHQLVRGRAPLRISDQVGGATLEPAAARIHIPRRSNVPFYILMNLAIGGNCLE